MKLMRRLNYLAGSLRLLVLKLKGIYQGKVLQRIPTNVSLSVNGKSSLSFSDGILFRGPGYLSVSGGVLTLDRDVFINTGSYIVCRKKIFIGAGTVIGPNVCIVDHDHDYKSGDMRNTFKCSDVYIGKNVWIGANAVILRGTSIGDNCVVGAGAVVNGEYPADHVITMKREIRVKPIER